jgi:hypothetical protein
MQEAKGDPTVIEKSQSQVRERHSARQRAKDELGLRERQESGTTDTFHKASQIQHKRDAQGKTTMQEPGRPTKAALNMRPSQRKHPQQQ